MCSLFCGENGWKFCVLAFTFNLFFEKIKAIRNGTFWKWKLWKIANRLLGMQKKGREIFYSFCVFRWSGHKQMKFSLFEINNTCWKLTELFYGGRIWSALLDEWIINLGTIQKIKFFKKIFLIKICKNASFNLENSQKNDSLCTIWTIFSSIKNHTTKLNKSMNKRNFQFFCSYRGDDDARSYLNFCSFIFQFGSKNKLFLKIPFLYSIYHS